MLLPECLQISAAFVHTYQCQAPQDSTCEKELQDGGRFPKRVSMQCVSFLINVFADVLKHNYSPAGENELSFVVGTYAFLILAMIRAFSLLRSSRHRGKTRWMLIAGFTDEIWML